MRRAWAGVATAAAERAVSVGRRRRSADIGGRKVDRAAVERRIADVIRNERRRNEGRDARRRREGMEPQVACEWFGSHPAAFGGVGASRRFDGSVGAQRGAARMETTPRGLAQPARHPPTLTTTAPTRVGFTRVVSSRAKTMTRKDETVPINTRNRNILLGCTIEMKPILALFWPFLLVRPVSAKTATFWPRSHQSARLTAQRDGN